MMLLWTMMSAYGAGVDSAELRRLEDELVKLATRNTWTGVERTYRRLLEMQTKLAPLDHQLGAKAALAQGETLLAYYRLRRARDADPGVDPAQEEARVEAGRELESIESRYGLVSIYAGAGAVPVLYREVMPFGQEERDAIVAAQKRVTQSHAFRGLLPVGTYAVDAVKFEVVPGDEWLVVTAGQR
jgi:hypothetical protein